MSYKSVREVAVQGRLVNSARARISSSQAGMLLNPIAVADD